MMVLLMDNVEHYFCQGGRRLTPTKYMYFIIKMVFEFLQHVIV
jgi:hypothetical protein